MIQQTTAQANRVIALEVFQHLADFGARFRAHDKVKPGGVRACTRCGNNLYRLATRQRLRQRVGLSIDACAYAGVADIGMYRIGEVDRRRTGRQLNDAPFRCENVNLIREEIGFNAFDKFKGATCALLELKQALHPALGADLCGGAALAVLFISPVCRNPHLRHLVHIFSTDLHLNRHAVRANHRGVQRLIAVRFRNGDIVLHASRTRLVEAVHLTQHAIAGVEILNNHPERIDVHDRVKTLLFQHHLAIDGVEMLLATAHTAGDTRLLQTPFDLREDFLNHLFTVAARGLHHLFNHAVAVRVQRFKAQLFQLGFDVVDT